MVDELKGYQQHKRLTCMIARITHRPAINPKSIQENMLQRVSPSLARLPVPPLKNLASQSVLAVLRRVPDRMTQAAVTENAAIVINPWRVRYLRKRTGLSCKLCQWPVASMLEKV